jgi:hypothetical protein
MRVNISNCSKSLHDTSLLKYLWVEPGVEKMEKKFIFCLLHSNRHNNMENNDIQPNDTHHNN